MFHLLLASLPCAFAFVSRLRDVASTDAATHLMVTDNFLELRRSMLTTASSGALQNHIVQNVSTPLRPVSYGASYAARLTLQDEDLLVLFDTGSSDTWIASKDFRCVDYFQRIYPQSACQLGPLFNGSFPDGPIQNENFNTSYGSGEYVIGEVGYMDVALAGLTFTKQEIAIVDEAYWAGDNVTTGLLGFAYRALTSSYPGDDPSQDDPNKPIQYSPMVQTAFDRGLFSMFSLALGRGTGDVAGYLALGGLPPVACKQPFTSTPILQTDLSQIGRSGQAYSFYTILPAGFILGGASSSRFRMVKTLIPNQIPFIVDSGTTLNYFPSAVAQKINSMFSPPAQFNPNVGLFETDCNAKPPIFGVRINGTDFMINAADMVITGQLGYDPDSGKCITGIQASRGPYILGDVFLKNVVSVFDVGAGQMRFASR